MKGAKFRDFIRANFARMNERLDHVDTRLDGLTSRIGLAAEIAPHPNPLPASGEREGPAKREGEGPANAGRKSKAHSATSVSAARPSQVAVRCRRSIRPDSALPQCLNLRHQRSERRSSKLSVKKNVPPGTRLRRSSGTQGSMPRRKAECAAAFPPYACCWSLRGAQRRGNLDGVPPCVRSRDSAITVSTP
jgi:hypothetical protein